MKEYKVVIRLSYSEMTTIFVEAARYEIVDGDLYFYLNDKDVSINDLPQEVFNKSYWLRLEYERTC